MKRLKFSIKWYSLIVCSVFMALIFALSSSVYALPTPTMQIKIWTADDPSQVDYITDQQTGVDADTRLGVMKLYGYTIGDFILTMVTGYSKPSQGSSESTPKLIIESMQVQQTTTGTDIVHVEVSDTGFGPLASGLNQFETVIDGHFYAEGSGVITLESWYSNSNDLFGKEQMMSFLGPFDSELLMGTDDFDQLDVFSNPLPTTPFSLTLAATVTENDGGSSSFSAATTATPEPGTIILLGLGMLGVGLIGRKKIGIKE